MGISGFFATIIGYPMQWIYSLVQNYGISIIILTVIVRLCLLPLYAKQIKTSAKMAGLQAKQKEIQSKYANNRQKMNEELQALYQKEGVSPTGGCLTSIIPLFIMLGIFYAVAYPLTNTLHINGDTVNNATAFIKSLPGFSISGGGAAATYEPIALVKILTDSKEAK